MKILLVCNFIFKRLVLLAVTVIALAAAGQTARAQGVDFSKAEIKATKLASNFYSLEGPGGTMGVLVGPDGAFLVDSQFAPMTDKIVAAVKQLSPAPIRFLANTHIHGDHTGGDENFGKMGVTIIGRPELRERLMHPLPAANGTPGVPMPAAGLPTITYEGRVTFHMNGQDIILIAIPHAHTDGDTLVYFPQSDVIMCGDFYRSIQYPNMDRANGGSLNGLIDGLGVLIGLSGPNTKIVPGHGPAVGRAEVLKTRDMALVVRDRVAQMVAQGKTLEEVMAAHPTAEYDASVPNAKETTERYLTQSYLDLKGAK